MLTRRTFLGRMLAGAVVLGGLRVPGARGSTSVLHQLRVRNAAKSFVGDRRLFATISPRSGTGRAGATVVSTQPVPLATGKNRIPWAPAGRERHGLARDDGRADAVAVDDLQGG